MKLLHRIQARWFLPLKWAKSQRIQAGAIVKPDANWGLWLIQNKEKTEKIAARWHRVGDPLKLAHQTGKLELIEELMNIKAYGSSSEQSGK